MIKPYEIPTYLTEAIERIRCVTNYKEGLSNESFARTMINELLFSCLFEESKAMEQEQQATQLNPWLEDAYNAALQASNPLLQSTDLHSHSSSSYLDEDAAKLMLMYETHFESLVTHRGEKKLLSGFADYSIWYDSAIDQKLLATNLLIIKAKKYGTTTLALPQLAAYMGVIHTTRKADRKYNAVVYGVALDAEYFIFCRINNDGIFMRSRMFEWGWQAQEIYSIFRSLLRAAALSSPSTTLIKDPLRRRIVLEYDKFHDERRSEKFEDDELEDYEEVMTDDDGNVF